jgi:hypothetical protein
MQPKDLSHFETIRRAVTIYVPVTLFFIDADGEFFYTDCFDHI